MSLFQWRLRRGGVDVNVYHSKMLNFHRRFSGGKVFATIGARQKKIIMVSGAIETRTQTRRNASDNSGIHEDST